MTDASFGAYPLAVRASGVAGSAPVEFADRVPVGGTGTPQVDTAGAFCPHAILPCVYSADGSGLGTDPATLIGLTPAAHTLTTQTIAAVDALLIRIGRREVSPTENAIYYDAEFLLLT